MGLDLDAYAFFLASIAQSVSRFCCAQSKPYLSPLLSRRILARHIILILLVIARDLSPVNL
jgi:hypothetical protein